MSQRRWATAAAALATLTLAPAGAAAAVGDIFNLAGRSDSLAEGVRGRGVTSGPATLATLLRPSDVARAADGSLLVADPVLRRVYRVSRTGRIAPVAGSGGGGVDGDGGPALAARIGAPVALAATPDGGFLILEQSNPGVPPAPRETGIAPLRSANSLSRTTTSSGV